MSPSSNWYGKLSFLSLWRNGDHFHFHYFIYASVVVLFEAFKDILRDDDARSTVFHLFQMELSSSDQQWLAAFNLLGLNDSL